VVQVSSGQGDDLVVQVLESPAGQAAGSFRLPWSPAEWPLIRASLGRGNRDLDAAGFRSFPPSPQQIGEELFRALFSGQVGLLWARSLGVVPDLGLRLQLRFKLDRQPPGASLLHALPWELLRQPDTRDFLALSRQTPVVRYLEVPRPVSPLRRPPVLLILVVISAPTGLPSLDFVRERREVQEAWGKQPEVEVEVLEKPCARALREAVLSRPYNILHFIGHGKLDPQTGEGLLFFEDENGAADPVPGEALVTLLKDVKSLRLVFLNACDTARAAREEGLDPFAGVATALVMAGLPAVVAMQRPISDEAAITFSRAVHLRLAAGEPLDTAVTEGRQAIFASDHSSMEWAIPVLFTRIGDGLLFAPRERRAGEVSSGPFSKLGPLRLRTAMAVGLALLLGAFLLWALLAPEALERALTAFRRPVGRPPISWVRVESIRISRYEVTQRQFLQFVLANPRWRRDRIEPGLHDGAYLKSWISWRRYPPKLDDHPVTQVSWYAAEAFCEWMGGRLPRLKEWQEVAHTAEHRFPWGPERPALTPLNFCDRACLLKGRGIVPDWEDGFPETAPVGSFPAGRTREGVFDLSGNVWEWTADVSGTRRAILGGSYLSQLDECSTDRPIWEEATLCAPDGGFRCLRK
jgi:CHAT domain-containing protein/sulfatase-modifying factor enzyme 1